MITTKADPPSGGCVRAVIDGRKCVWQATGGAAAVETQAGWQDWVAQLVRTGCDWVRTHGGADHSAMLVALAAAMQRGALRRLQVCSPTLVGALDGLEADEVLLRMQTCNWAASVGGWHDFASSDLVSHALSVHFFSGAPVTDDTRTVQLLRSHPVWPALSFVSPLNLSSAAKLVALILDPRWFVDPSRPDRGSRLEQFLGLTPKIQTDVSDRQLWGGVRDRCRLVRSCWKEVDLPSSLGPRQFLWRAFEQRGGGRAGELAASKRLVAFLRFAWLDVVAPPGRRGRLFVPEYFFAGEEERKAYRRHLQKFQNP